MCNGLRVTVEQLHKGSTDVFWHLRQVLALSMHLDRLRKEGTVRIFDPLDAATLEAFAINARLLIDFIWRTRDETPKPRSTDLLAVDWFAQGEREWKPYAQPPHLQPIKVQVGKNIAHLTLRAEGGTGWQPREVADSLASAVAHFAADVPTERVVPDFRSAVEDAITAWRIEVESGEPIFDFRPAPRIPVATPANVTTATELRQADSTNADVQAWRERQRGSD